MPSYYIGRHIRPMVDRMDCECGPGYGFRNFLTKEEKIELLEEYKTRLEKEAKGVSETIDKLKKNN